MESEPKENLANLKEPKEMIEESTSTNEALETIPLKDDIDKTKSTNKINDLIKSVILNTAKENELANSLANSFEKHFNIVIDDITKTLILKVVDEYGDFFSDFEECIQRIIYDNKIDSKDIPDIMELLQKLYEFLYSQKNIKIDSIKIAEISGFLIKMSFYFLVGKDKIQITEDKKEEFLQQIEKLIDSCIALIKMTSLLKPQSCFKCVKSLF